MSLGSPVLGCAQPTCMAEPLEDYEDSVFIANAAGQEDGFFREGDRQRKSYSQSFKPKAVSSPNFPRKMLLANQDECKKWRLTNKFSHCLLCPRRDWSNK